MTDEVFGTDVQFGRYLFIRHIGTGGMGMVYAAHDVELGRTVAIKLLVRDNDPQLQARLRREAQAMAQLAHPNVVTVYDVGAVENRMFIAMEYIEGETLAQWLTRPRSLRDILETYCAAGRGLAAAHAAGIVHRDFKPENVLIGKDGRARVGDFGLACTVSDGAERDLDVTADAVASVSQISNVPDTLTASGVLLGTPYYMAPERYAGQEADARSDQFSFCVALFTALYGERPYARVMPRVVGAAARAGRRRLLTQPARVPRRVRAVLLRGLALEPTARFASLDDLLAALAPSSRRWIRFAIGAGAALAIIAWFIKGPLAGTSDPRCTGAAAAFATAWNRERQSKLAAAFTATSKPYAAEALDRVTGELDHYAARWIRGHTDACRATRILGEQTEPILELRMACFERRRQEVEALTTTFASADAAVVARAVDAVVELMDVGTCSDLAVLRLRVAPPASMAMRAKLTELTPRLADARASYQTGAYAKALERARAVALEAHAVGYLPFEAEVRLLQSEIERELGDVAGAAASLDVALRSAIAGGHDEVAAQAWSALVSVTGDSRSDFARGIELASYATAAIARIGGNPHIEAGLEQALGRIDFIQRKLDAALAHFDRAVALEETAFGAGHLNVAKALEKVAGVAIDRGRPARAIIVLRRVVDIYTRSLGRTHPAVAGALNTLGDAYTQGAQYALAEDLQRKALAMREGALGSRHPALVRNLADLGEALRHQGHLAEALGVERRSLALGESILSADDGRLAGVGYELGITLGRAGRYAEALARLRRAEALTAKIYGPEHVYVAFVVAARADVLMLESRWRDAVTLYDRVIPVFAVSQGTEDVLAGALANRCRAHVELHQPGRALPPLERLARDLLERPADVRVVVQFTLARALSQTGGDGARAYQLATEAAAEIRLIADARREDVAHVEHWLATHARCTTCSSRPP